MARRALINFGSCLRHATSPEKYYAFQSVPSRAGGSLTHGFDIRVAKNHTGTSVVLPAGVSRLLER
jgi:hypothetical protein